MDPRRKPASNVSGSEAPHPLDACLSALLRSDVPRIDAEAIRLDVMDSTASYDRDAVPADGIRREGIPFRSASPWEGIEIVRLNGWAKENSPLPTLPPSMPDFRRRLIEAAPELLDGLDRAAAVEALFGFFSEGYGSGDARPTGPMRPNGAFLTLQAIGSSRWGEDGRFVDPADSVLRAFEFPEEAVSAADRLFSEAPIWIGSLCLLVVSARLPLRGGSRCEILDSMSGLEIF